jgi:hypothetical protein
MTDDRGMIQMVNPRLEVLARREAHELLGRRAWPLILNGGPWHKESGVGLFRRA